MQNPAASYLFRTTNKRREKESFKLVATHQSEPVDDLDDREVPLAEPFGHPLDVASTNLVATSTTSRRSRRGQTAPDHDRTPMVVRSFVGRTGVCITVRAVSRCAVTTPPT